MIAWVLAAAALVAVTVTAAVAWRVHQRTSRRLLEVLERLGEPVSGRARSELVVERLERSLDRVRRHDDDVQLAEERLVLAFDELTVGVVVCDASGRVVLRNSFAAAFAEARHGEALVEAAVVDLLGRARRGERTDREMELFGPPRRVLLLHTAPLQVEGRLLGAIAVIDDITEQQRIDAVRRDFVANVSHELKTPIGALALLAETLTDEREAAVVQRLSRRIRDEAFRVSRMVDELLALSRIESDEAPRRELLSVADLVAEAVDRVRPVAERRSVPLEVEPPDPTLGLAGDRQQLVSALFNLLDNAVKYSEPKSPVTVRVAPGPGQVAITVQDRGIGIPTRDLERIFERFYRVDKARSRDTGGTGLGLSIVRHAVRNHGGEVRVASREGEGSTFTIVLPVEVVADRSEPRGSIG